MKIILVENIHVLASGSDFQKSKEYKVNNTQKTGWVCKDLPFLNKLNLLYQKILDLYARFYNKCSEILNKGNNCRLRDTYPKYE